MKFKPTVCVDFDGVLNTYTGWEGPDELYVPKEGAREFLETLYAKYRVIIFTTRKRSKVLEWLEEHGLCPFVDDVTDIKIGAVAYIDDRAICFNGDYQETLKELKGFKAHWERKRRR